MNWDLSRMGQLTTAYYLDRDGNRLPVRTRAQVIADETGIDIKIVETVLSHVEAE